MELQIMVDVVVKGDVCAKDSGTLLEVHKFSNVQEFQINK